MGAMRTDQDVLQKRELQNIENKMNRQCNDSVTRLDRMRNKDKRVRYLGQEAVVDIVKENHRSVEGENGGLTNNRLHDEASV